MNPYLFPASTEQNRPIFDLSQVYAERSPAYLRLDVRADQRFRWRGVNVVTFVDIQNLLDRENVLEYLWNAKTRSRDRVKQLARFIVGGVIVEFRASKECCP